MSNTGITNKDRATRAKKALKSYAGSEGGEAVIDVLTDIRHLCDQEGTDFYSFLRMSYQNYIAEKQGA